MGAYVLTGNVLSANTCERIPGDASQAEVEAMLQGWRGVRRDGAHAFSGAADDGANPWLTKHYPGCYTIRYTRLPGNVDEVVVVFNANGRVCFSHDND
jgi:hypothetical protein